MRTHALETSQGSVKLTDAQLSDLLMHMMSGEPTPGDFPIDAGALSSEERKVVLDVAAPHLRGY